MTATARDILTRRYAQAENVAVFSDLIIVWDKSQINPIKSQLNPK